MQVSDPAIQADRRIETTESERAMNVHCLFEVVDDKQGKLVGVYDSKGRLVRDVESCFVASMNWKNAKFNSDIGRHWECFRGTRCVAMVVEYQLNKA